MTDFILHLTAGKGPQECRWVVSQLAQAFIKEGLRLGIKCEILNSDDDLPASLLLSIEGNEAQTFVNERLGTIKWIGPSPFRPKHKRRNWFVGVTKAPSIENRKDLRDEDITYQAMRASGPGGQHVNKTDSAIRATHKPTGLVASAQEQRSQHANRKLAKLKLAIMLEEIHSQANEDLRQTQWISNQSLERGNSVRTYNGPQFHLKEKN
jgi:peptide chain release factor